MAEGVEDTFAMQLLSDVQDRFLVDTGVRLELTGGLALGVIDGVEKLCMLCPGCQRPTVGVIAWAQCGHCGIQLTRLGPVQQEVKYYFVKEKTGLCLPREWVIRKAGEGRVSPAAEELPSDSAESEPSGDQVGSTEKACDLAGDPGTVEVVAQSSEGTPEKPVSSEPFDLPVRKEPKPQEGDPSGERRSGCRLGITTDLAEIRINEQSI
ncbi:hypothetical protein AB205_0199140 [Aquarana catesbeiana]|uniref:Uncharacterized protein n=1 Tax=Aquarana catesbeiana TaxID=8400 RepID=A0A2G9RRG5_AQUCT|nr:hypothetical protein AB205_0199140 [Aquarana catesbeiana]